MQNHLLCTRSAALYSIFRTAGSIGSGCCDVVAGRDVVGMLDVVAGRDVVAGLTRSTGNRLSTETNSVVLK